MSIVEIRIGRPLTVRFHCLVPPREIGDDVPGIGDEHAPGYRTHFSIRWSLFSFGKYIDRTTLVRLPQQLYDFHTRLVKWDTADIQYIDQFRDVGEETLNIGGIRAEVRSSAVIGESGIKKEQFWPHFTPLMIVEPHGIRRSTEFPYIILRLEIIMKIQ